MAPEKRKNMTAPQTLEPVRKARTDPERLKAFARQLNLMLGELGHPERGRAKVIKDRVGVSGTTAANWLRGDSYPSFEELGRIGRLGVDPVRLFGEPTELTEATPKSTPVPLAESKRLARLIESGQLLPLTQLKTAPGGWGHTAVPNRILQQLLGQNLIGYVVFCMQGDAMADRIKDGTPLLIDTTVTRITEDSAVYALLHGDTVIVRRIQHLLQGGYLIACDNPVIADETIERLGSHRDDSANARDIIVLGRVSAAIQKL